MWYFISISISYYYYCFNVFIFIFVFVLLFSSSSSSSLLSSGDAAHGPQMKTNQLSPKITKNCIILKTQSTNHRSQSLKCNYGLHVQKRNMCPHVISILHPHKPHQSQQQFFLHLSLIIIHCLGVPPPRLREHPRVLHDPRMSCVDALRP